jgi:hypothetical protein
MNQKISEERQRYNQELLKTSGINTTATDEDIIESYAPARNGYRQQLATTVASSPSADYVKEPYDMKVKGRVSLTEVIIVVFIIIALFVIINMYISQKRMELMLHYYGKFVKHMKCKM